MSWETVKTSPNIVQVIPLEDEAGHCEFVDTEMSEDVCRCICYCECEPLVELTENRMWIVIHRSFDGREGLEWAKEILSSSSG